MIKRKDQVLSPSRTLLERMTPEEIEDQFGPNFLAEVTIKALEPHDSARTRRNMDREEKALRRKEKRQKYRR
ncbi:MAG: hypothetical protein BroJett025_11390 [Patescibacteria group bacterium]|nr:MAG: hypothetical protein BroJett025_11390 [Patescibacteria group bacterium]